MSQKVHPYINYVVETLKNTGENIKRFDGFSVLNDLYVITNSVEPKVKTGKKWVDLNGEIFSLIKSRMESFKPETNYQGFTDKGVKVEKSKSFDSDHYLDFLQLLPKIWELMWDNGYLIDETFKYFDPSDGKSSE